MLLEHRASKAPFAEKESFGGWDPDDDSLDPHTQGWTNVSPLEIQPLSVACVGPNQWEVEVEVTEELLQTVVKDGKWLARKVCFNPVEDDCLPILSDPPPPSNGNFSSGRLLILRSTRADRLVPGTIARLVFEFQDEIRPRARHMFFDSAGLTASESDMQRFGPLLGTLAWGARVSKTRPKGRPSERYVHIPVRLPAKGGA